MQQGKSSKGKPPQVSFITWNVVSYYTSFNLRPSSVSVLPFLQYTALIMINNNNNIIEIEEKIIMISQIHL